MSTQLFINLVQCLTDFYKNITLAFVAASHAYVLENKQTKVRLYLLIRRKFMYFSGQKDTQPLNI